MHVPKEHRSKLDSKSIPHIFLGHNSLSKAYEVWDSKANKPSTTSDVVFHELLPLFEVGVLPLPPISSPSTLSSSSSSSPTPSLPHVPILVSTPTNEGDSLHIEISKGKHTPPQRTPRWLY